MFVPISYELKDWQDRKRNVLIATIVSVSQLAGSLG